MPLVCPSTEYSRCNLGGLTIISEAFLSSCKNCFTSSEFMRSFLMMTFLKNSSSPSLRWSNYFSVILKRKLFLGRGGRLA